MTTNPSHPDFAIRPPALYGCGVLVPQRWVWAVRTGDHVHSRIPGGGERCHLDPAGYCLGGFGPLRTVGYSMADVLAAPYPPGLPTSPAEVGAALVSMRNTFWARDPQPMTLDLLPTPDAPAPPDSLRDAYRDLFHDGFDLVEPGPARYNFVVIRREDNDLAAVLVDDGQALVDDPDAGGVRTFPDVPALVEAYGGERRVKLVWERDQWPPSMNRFGADAMHLLSAAIRARHLGAHPYDRLGPAAPPVP